MGQLWSAETEATGSNVTLRFSREGSQMQAVLPRKSALALADSIYSTCGRTAPASASKTAAAPAKKPRGR